MMHPYGDHTLLIIDIQASNQLEILTCVRETFAFMPGWEVASSVMASPTNARFYAFNLTLLMFEWWRTNDSFSDTRDEDEVPIRNLADISHLLEFVFLNGDRLRKVPSLADEFESFFGHPPYASVPAPPKKKRQPSGAETPMLPELHNINISKLEAKLKEFENPMLHKPDMSPLIIPLDMSTIAETIHEPSDYLPKYNYIDDHNNSVSPWKEFIKFVEMPQPKAKVFYKDLSKKVACEYPPPEVSWGTDEEIYNYCMKTTKGFDPPFGKM